MQFHGNVRGEVRMNFLALFASKPNIFMCGALKLFRILRVNVRLNFRHSKSVLVPEQSDSRCDFSTPRRLEAAMPWTPCAGIGWSWRWSIERRSRG